MNRLVRSAWVLLALLHAPPASVLAAPELASRLYGVSLAGDAAILLTHRGALFLAVAAGCLLAAIDPGARRAMSVVVAVSMLSFLVLYAGAASPGDALGRIALFDLVGLAPLAWAAVSAWRPQRAPIRSAPNTSSTTR